MRRTALHLAAACFLLASAAFAEDAAAPTQKTPAARRNVTNPDQASPSAAMTDLENEVHAMHQLLDLQSKQLETLARELAQVSLQVGELRGGAAPAAHSEAPVAETPAPPAAAEIPKAEPVLSPTGGLKHPVEKGETLTSIAKHYNIPVAELQKANKIQNDRKLQIGQILSIPANKSPEPPTEKKENP